MRDIFLEAIKQLEYEDDLFQAGLAAKVTLATSLETWAVAPAVGQKLYELVLQYQPQQIVEVGTSLGYSTMWMAEAARSYGGKIITLEHESSKIAKTQKLFEDLELQETVTLVHTDAKEFLKNYTEKIDFLFLDALKREYIEYLQLAEKNLAAGSLVLADDVITWRRKLDDFFNYLEISGKYKTQVFELGHGLLVTEKIS